MAFGPKVGATERRRFHAGTDKNIAIGKQHPKTSKNIIRAAASNMETGRATAASAEARMEIVGTGLSCARLQLSYA